MVLVSKSKKPASIEHQKRSGQHHKRNKPYAKAYWPYLPMMAIIGIGFLAHTFWPQPGGGVLAYATNMSSAALLQATNAERIKAGQSDLSSNAQLTSAAQAKANDMAARNYWSHVTPDGVQPWWFVTNAGYDYTATGENLAYGFSTGQATVIGWMNSPGHRANILTSGYQDVGFGVANAAAYQNQGEETIVVALYGTQVQTIATDQAVPQSDVTSSPAGSNQKPPSSAQAVSSLDSMDPAVTAPTQTSTSPADTPSTAIPAPYSGQQTDRSDQPVATSADIVRLAPVGTDRPVARLQLVAAQISPWELLATTLIISVAAVIFIVRHIFFWHKALAKGERFFIKHWKIDLIVIAIIVVGTLLTHTVGFIQ